MDRRTFLAGSAALVAACRDAAESSSSSVAAPPSASAASEVLRIASVRTAIEGGLLPRLVERFEATSRYRLHVTTGSDVYVQARHGLVDLVISHYGHHDAEQFVLDGRGEWPRTVFSNQMALLGPPSDPAQIRGLDDAGEAFRRIAAAGAPFIVNDLDGVRYLTEILWNAAGKPPRTGWLVDQTAPPFGGADGRGHARAVDDELSRAGAIERAAALGGYTLWGLTPFLRTQSSGPSPAALEPLVLGDPLLQRMLVSIVVKPGAGIAPVNLDAAHAFQSFLLAPETQASIRTVTYPGAPGVHWVAAGRHNRTAVLPRA